MIKDDEIIDIGAPKLSAAERLYMPQILGGMATTLRHAAKSLLLTKRMTIEYPEKQREVRVDNYRGIHRLNRDEQGRVACVACFMCSTACPADCIHIEAAESPWDDREKYPVNSPKGPSASRTPARNSPSMTISLQAGTRRSMVEHRATCIGSPNSPPQAWNLLISGGG